jgi:iron-sulfur cluster insertion protein
MDKMITVTESAVKKLKEILAEENNPDLKVRMFVSGGGCSGMQYGFTLEDQPANEDDFDLEVAPGVHMLVDAMSGQYVQGAEVDWKESVQGAQFAISNPNAQTTCGCGSSFSPS